MNVIAIDGPAGSGKSTIAKAVARQLGYLYIDTGAMYRALTVKAMRAGFDLNDEASLISLSQETKITLEPGHGSLTHSTAPTPRDQKSPLRVNPEQAPAVRPGRAEGLKVLLDGEDVSERIRELEVSEKVKFIARVKDVRTEMVKRQRALGEKANGAVLEGRDIGTVVFPDARCKIFLDASFGTRVERRFREFQEKGAHVSLEDVKKDLEARDRADTTRAVGALKQAHDAARIDTTAMSIAEVTAEILRRRGA